MIENVYPWGLLINSLINYTCFKTINSMIDIFEVHDFQQPHHIHLVVPPHHSSNWWLSPLYGCTLLNAKSFSCGLLDILYLFMPLRTSSSGGWLATPWASFVAPSAQSLQRHIAIARAARQGGLRLSQRGWRHHRGGNIIHNVKHTPS